MRRSRAGAALALAAALLAGGCGATEGIQAGGTIIGETLTVFSLLPDAGEGRSRDLVDGQRLALREAGGRRGAYKITFVSIDETQGATGEELPGKVASVARQAIADSQIVAAIGDLDARTAQITVPLLNSAGILHVSPGVTYPGFTRRVEPGEPGRWYPAGPRTFFPLAPDDAAQGRALAGALRGRVLVEQEESPSGRAFGAALRAALGPDRLARSAPQAAAAVYAGTDPESAKGVVEGLLRENPRIDVHLHTALAGTELDERPRVRALSAQPGPGGEFARRFRAAFGRDPGPAAQAGHAAMGAVLDAIGRAGAGAGRRAAVIDAFRRRDVPPPRLWLEGRELR